MFGSVQQIMEGKENDGKTIYCYNQLLDGETIYCINQLLDRRKIYNCNQLLDRRKMYNCNQLLDGGEIYTYNQLLDGRTRTATTNNKKAPSATAKKDEKAVNAARQAGADIETAKKYNAGTNKAASSSTSLNTKRLDEDTENLAHDRVPTELKKAIMQARMDKKLTQAQLAQMINEKPRVIQEYGSGKAIPNQQIISKLERALGTKLRGKK